MEMMMMRMTRKRRERKKNKKLLWRRKYKRMIGNVLNSNDKIKVCKTHKFHLIDLHM